MNIVIFLCSIVGIFLFILLISVINIHIRILWIRLYARIHGMAAVWLLDHDGEVSWSLASRSPWGDLIAKRIDRTITLLDNGKVAGESYVLRWKLVDGEKLPK